MSPVLNQPSVERLLVGLGVVEVLEEQLDAAGAAQPQLAGLALGAQLAGVLVDDGELVAGRDVAHRALGQLVGGLAVGGVDDGLGHAVRGVHVDAEHLVEHRHDEPEHADAQRVFVGLVGLHQRGDHERHQRDVRDLVASTTSQKRLVDHFGMSTAVAPTPRTENIDQLCAFTWKSGR